MKELIKIQTPRTIMIRACGFFFMIFLLHKVLLLDKSRVYDKKRIFIIKRGSSTSKTL